MSPGPKPPGVQLTNRRNRLTCHRCRFSRYGWVFQLALSGTHKLSRRSHDSILEDMAIFGAAHPLASGVDE